MKAYAVVSLMTILLVLATLAYLEGPPVQAAPIAPVPDYCVLTSTIGPIATYFCEPDVGPDYLTNNVGWIEKVD